MVAKGDRVAIATVVDTRRSAPRPLGSRLAVSSAGEMVGSVSGGCVESDVYLRAEEVLAGGPPQLLQYGISDDDAFDVGLPCGGEIEVFVQMLDPEELDRIDSAVQSGERLSVTTTLNGDSAGAKAYGEGEGHSSAVRTDETTFVEHFAPPPVVVIFGAVDTGAGAVPDGQAGRLHDDRLGRPREVRDAGAAAGRRRDHRRMAGDGLRRTTRSTTPPTSSSSRTTRASTSPRWARRCAPTRRTSARSAAGGRRPRAASAS